jgi:serine/threonine protein kinase
MTDEAFRGVDHFRVVRLLGRGGMGEVYLARDDRLGRKVALKLIKRDALGAPGAAEQFLREARITASLSHPHIVTVYGAGETGDGHPYVALEYIEGESLRQRLAQRRTGTREVLRIGLAIAEALATAHGAGVLHRDLKPENVVIPRDGRLRVVDFGLARRADDGEADESATLVGTPAYMAPERWFEMPSSGATDVWSLGVVLFEMCAGRLPFPQRALAALARDICGAGSALALADHARVPPALAELVDRCLAKIPDDRPTAAALCRELAGLLRARAAGRDEGEEPFRGLLPFTEQHADLYVGREAEIARFVERVRLEPVLPVVGASGAGTSRSAGWC